MTDAELRTLIYQSPKEGHAALFQEYYGLVYTIIYSRLHGNARPEDIEECVSDVFADLFFSFDTGFSYDGSIKGYIRMIATRRAIDAYRKLSAHSEKEISVDDTYQIPSGENLAENAEQAEISRLLLQSIEELGEPDTTIILQRYYYGHSSKEIAKGLSITPSAVRKRCGKALAKLKKRLIQLGIDG